MVHDPFNGTVPQLRSLSSGLTAREGDGINCHEAEKVDEVIQRSMDGNCMLSKHEEIPGNTHII